MGGAGGPAFTAPGMSQHLADSVQTLGGKRGRAVTAADSGLIFGDPDDSVDLIEAELAVAESSGKLANLIARTNAQLKELRSRDERRLDLSRLPIQKINGRWYHRFGSYLVDGAIDEKTELIIVRFASGAYFDLVGGRPDLRAVLATRRHVVVMVNATQALLIADDTGTEEFSNQQVKQFGLLAR